jgi:hypothetical protein
MIVDHGEWPLDLPDAAPSGGRVVWLFGRGLSIECKLEWTEPAEWKKELSRIERIERIMHVLRDEMDSPSVDPVPVREFLMLLDQDTAPEWRHLFVTTNWDYLLQREISALLDGSALPGWLDPRTGSHVYHLNGTVEAGRQHRSCFLLEDDSGPQRIQTTEANYAFNHMICERTFVVVGMSFECDTDKFLLTQLNKIEDWMPIGESHWIIVNPNRETSEAVCARIREALPAAHVESVKSKFGDWRHAECPSLKAKGVFRNRSFRSPLSEEGGRFTR